MKNQLFKVKDIEYSLTDENKNFFDRVNPRPASVSKQDGGLLNKSFIIRAAVSRFTDCGGISLPPRRFCAAPQVRRLPSGGFADQRLFNSRGPRKVVRLFGARELPSKSNNKFLFLISRSQAEASCL